MSAGPAPGHGGTGHAHDVGGPHDGAGDGWKVLDAIVWAAVVVVVVIGTEWLIGYLVRERLARAIHPEPVASES